MVSASNNHPRPAIGRTLVQTRANAKPLRAGGALVCTLSGPDPSSRGAMAHIERVQVEAEGFLANLDVTFRPGLNAIIGARGTGKTSIVELIRYALGAGSFSDEVLRRGTQQSVAILDGGAVTVTVVDDDERFIITRSASGQVTRSAPGNVTCTVLAQNEIESVGAKASGRLHLIDRFRFDRNADDRNLNALRLSVQSITTEISSVIAEGRSLNEQIEALHGVAEQLQQATAVQTSLLSESATSKGQQEELERLQNASQVIAIRESTLASDSTTVERFRSSLQRLTAEVPQLLADWPIEAGPDPLEEQRSRLTGLQALLVDVELDLAGIQDLVRSSQSETEELRAAVDAQSRQLRQTLENTTTGISRAARAVAELEERHGQLQALRSARDARREQYLRRAAERDDLFGRLDNQLERVFNERQSIVGVLNRELGPSIRVRLTKSAEVSGYQAAIVAGLRGSGLHYNQLAPAIANSVSPLELVTWVETGDAVKLAASLGISEERARSVVEALQAEGTAAVVAAVTDDGAEIDLLDGAEYKPTGQLSIGQRCTVVLPILLRHRGDPLVMDQPEDHLDNAFVASTLVPTLRQRGPFDQYIVTTHNANIPVLGEAQQIVVMESDGERGFARHQGALDEPAIVSAVSNILEGGSEAFARRAKFYGVKGK